MPAGSVRLPELQQTIKVDTKDLARAEAAAKKFKQNLNRELRGNHDITVDVKGNFDRLRQQLKSFDGEVTANVGGDFTKLRNQLKAFNGETEAKVSGDLTRLREQLRAFDGDIEVDPHLNVAKLKAELAALSKTDLKFDADITEAERKTGELKTLAEAVSDRKYELVFVVRENDARALTRLREETVAETRAMGDFEGQADRLRDSLNGLTRGLESTTRAKTAFGRASAEQRAELERARQAVNAAEAGLKGARAEASQAAKDAAGSEKTLTTARRDAEKATKAIEVADRALADAHGAAEVAAARLQAAEAKTGAVFAQSLPAFADVEKAERDLAAARAEQERVDGIVGRAEGQLAELRSSGTASAKELEQAERYLAFTRGSQPAAIQKVEDALGRLTAAQGRQAAAEARVVAAAAASKKADEDHERSLAAVTAATERLAQARQGSEASAARVVELERGVVDAHRAAEQAAGRTRAAETDLARASQELVQVRERVGQALRKSAEDATRAENSHRAFLSTVRGTASAAGLATKAIAGLGIAGTVAGGVGILGGAAVGLGSALTGAAPAALGLAGALGGVAVTAGGLAAIFKSNEGLKGSSEILKTAFQGIQDDLQRRVNPSIIEFMRSVAGLAPIAREMVPPFATAFNEIATMFSNLLKDSSFQSDLRTIVASGIRQFRSFGEAGRNAIQGIISLAAATGPFIERIAQGFVELTADFRNWVNEARRTGELNRLLETSTTIIQSLGRTVRDLAVGFKNLFTAADVSGFTAQVLGALNGIASDFRTFTAERQQELQAMFKNLGVQVEGLRPLFASLANGIREILTNINLRPLMDAIQAIVPELARTVTEAANAIARIAAQAAPAINSLLSTIRAIIPDVERVISTVVRNVTQVVDAVRPGIQQFARMLADVGDRVIPVIAGAARNLGAAFSTVMPVVRVVATAIGSIVGLLGDMSGAAGVAVTAFLGFKVLQGIFGGAAQGASRLWQGVNNLAKGTTESGKKVGVLQGALRGLAQPFAAAVVGAKNLGQGLVEATRGTTSFSESQSGILRGLAQLGQGFTTGGQRATEFGTSATRAGTAVTTAASSLSTSMSSALTGFGRSVQDAGTRLTGLAGTVSTTSQRMTAGLGGAVTTAGGLLSRFGETVGTVGTHISAGLGTATQTAVGHLGRLGSGAASVASGGLSVLSRGVSGVVDALGGPWGVAIGGAIAVLTTLGQRSQEAMQYQNNLRTAFEQSAGQIDKNVTSMVRANLEQSNLATGAQSLGMSMDDLVQVAMKGGPALDDVANRLEEGSNVLSRNVPLYAELSANLGSTTAANAELADALREVKPQMDAVRASMEAANAKATASEQALSGADRAARNVSTGFNQMKQSAGDASKFVDGLSTALDGISGRSKSADEANKSFGESLRNMAQAAGDGSEKIKIINGDLDEQSAAGGRAYDAVSQLREATLQKAAADFQAAGGTSNLGAAQAAANDALTKGKQAMVDSLTQMGANRQEAQRYADQLFAIPPEVLTKILADPANAEKIVKDWQAGVKNPPGGPPAAPFTGDQKPADDAVKKWQDFLKGGTPTPAPVGADVKPGQASVDDWKKKLEAGQAPKLPTDADTKPADQSVDQTRTNIEGTPATLPVGGNLLVEQQVQAFVGRLNAYQAAVLPVNANVAPGEQQALAWVARINAYAAAVLPINANVQPGEAQALAWVARINGFQGAIMPINVDYRPGEQTLLAWVDMIRGYTQAILPIYGDTAPLMNDVRNAIAQISRMRAIVPVYGQFMGVIGMPGGGGGIPGFANGAVVPNKTGKVAEFFANGGMTAKDKATLKALSNVSMHDAGDLSQSKMAKGQGLTPMKGGLAQIIPPNSWRVIGDRMVDDEAYIPINRSQRSHMLLEETAKRMGYALEQFAQGAVSNAAGAASNGGAPSQGRADSATSSSVVNNNHTEAPVVNGDLIVQVPQGTTPAEAFNEVNFQLRRMKTGGKYRRNGGAN